MLRKYYLFQIAAIAFLIFCASNFASAQKIREDKTALANFEKSIEAGNYQAVERDLLSYAIQNPKDAKAFELLARLRFEQNRLNEAKSLYQKALSLDSNLTSAKINLAVINFQTGNAEQAVSDLNQITDRDVSGDALRLNLANAFALVGDCRAALENVEKLAVNVRNSDALPVRAVCYLQLGEREKVNSLIVSVKNIVKQNPATALKFAEVLSRTALYKESAEVLRSIIAVAPNNADALSLLAKSEIYLKDLANAEKHLSQASRINAASQDLIFVRSLLESERGNDKQSLDLLEKSLAANPNSADVLSQYIITAIRAGYAGKAVKAAKRLLELKPDEPDFLYLYGAASLQNNNLPAAESSLKKYFEMRPQDSRGCVALGLTYSAQTEKFDVARAQLRKCIEINPDNFEAKYQLGLSYKTQGEPAEAAEYFEAAVKDAPNNEPVLRDLGAVYLQTAREAKARIVLEKAVRLNPNDADAHFQLSRAYSLLGEPELAKKHLKIFQDLKNPKMSGM